MLGYSIKNISISEYFDLEDTSKYDIFLNNLNPSDKFNGKKCDLSKLTFDEVEVIKTMLSKPNFKNIKDVFIFLFKLGSFEQSAENEFLNTSIFDLFKVQSYLNEWIETIIKRENNALSNDPDEKLIMINAGERLSAVSHLLTKIRLAEQFGTNPDVIGSWKYTKVFSILVANKRSSDVQRDYAKQK